MHNRRSLFLSRRYLLVFFLVGIFMVLWSMLLYAVGASQPQQAIAAPQRAPYAICDTVQGISFSECEGLVDFYNSTGGDGWIDNSGWLQTNTPCSDWKGIECQANSIFKIILVSNTLTGMLPPTIDKLPSLSELVLRNNRISGTIPIQLGMLGALRVLALSGNQLTGDIGAIPWDNFRQMIDLRLDDNQFTGQIPPVLGEWEDLTKLYLHANNLSGAIPNTFGAYCNNGIGGMCKLTELLLGRTGITGTLPISLGNLHNLRLFDINNNHITGTVPAELGNWQNLTQFAADNNNLQGDLSIFTSMTALSELRLHGNFFAGTLPIGLGALTNLQTLWLHNNQLRGPVPPQIACLPKYTKTPIVGLQLAANMLYVDDEMARVCLSNLVDGGDYRIVLGHQTVPPTNVRTGDITERYVELQWEPIYRADLAGYYEIAYVKAKEEPPIYRIRTGDQRTARYQVKDLDPGTDYYFYVRTYTPPTGQQKNALISWAHEPLIKVRTPGVAPRLVFTKEVTPTIAAPGQEVTYRLTIVSNEEASTLTMTDTLPVSVTLSGAPSGGAQVVDGKIRYVGSLAPNVPQVIEYRATIGGNVTTGSLLFSTAVASRNDPAAPERHVAAASVAVAGNGRINTLALIYVSGDNDLGSHMQQLFQKAEAATMPAGMVTLLLYDGPEVGDAYYYRLQHDTNQTEHCPTAINPSCNGRYQANVTFWRWDELVGTYTSLYEFVASAMQAYPADTVILSLVGHGSGWTPTFLADQPTTHDEKPDNRFYGGFLWDGTPTSALSTTQLRLALDEAVARTGKTIDLLYLDACFMAMAEVAYEVKDAVAYLLASESTSWTSFRYDLHLSWDAPPSDARVIGKRWIENEVSELSDAQGARYPYTYALLDLSDVKATRLITLYNQLATALVDALTHDTTAKQRIKTAVNATACLDGNQDSTIDQQDYYCDLYSFTDHLITAMQPSADQLDPATIAINRAVIETATALRDFLDPAKADFVLAEAHSSVEHPHHLGDLSWKWGKLGGLSIYLPLRSDSDHWARRYYSAAFLRWAADSYGDEFIDAYWGYAKPPVDPARCLGCIPRGQDILPSHNLFLPIVQR